MDYVLGFFGLIMKLGPIANWGLNLDKKTKTLEKVAEESEDLKRKKEKGDGTNIVPISNNTNQVNNFDNNTIISTPIVDPTRILFRAAGVSG